VQKDKKLKLANDILQQQIAELTLKVQKIKIEDTLQDSKSKTASNAALNAAIEASSGEMVSSLMNQRSELLALTTKQAQEIKEQREAFAKQLQEQQDQHKRVESKILETFDNVKLLKEKTVRMEQEIKLLRRENEQLRAQVGSSSSSSSSSSSNITSNNSSSSSSGGGGGGGGGGVGALIQTGSAPELSFEIRKNASKAAIRQSVEMASNWM
jgi:hypothetical protein